MILDEYQGYFAPNVDREELLQVAESLPAMPTVATKALRLIDDPNSTTRELAEVLSKDASLAARVLQMSNSAAFAPNQQVTTLEQATALVGLAGLRSVVIASVLRGIKARSSELQKLVWQNSVATAIAARGCQGWLNTQPEDDLFLCGLLHNLGQLIFLAHPRCAEDYQAVLTAVRERNLDFATAELEIIGFSYPLIGALGANRWGLPKGISYVVLHHNDPFEGIDSPADALAALVNFARFLVRKSGIGYAEGLGLTDEQARSIALALGAKLGDFDRELEARTHKLKERLAAELAAFKP